jgi:N-acetylglucosaminyldiphosphoundecaprenol N-acetyl-beta-D-mannosaminyltransferase
MTTSVPQKQFVVSVGISKTNYNEVVRLCHQWVADRRNGVGGNARYICVTSVHGVMMAKDDPEIAHILNRADIATPDGMPIVWALRSFGSRNQQRVYGPTLMLELCRSAAENGHRIFLYGGLEDTLPLLEASLLQRFPKLIIADRYSPPFRPLTPSEDQHVQAMIHLANADIVFVGISTPKQERWMYEHRQTLPGVILIGVGAAFDFHAGRTQQAPAWMQRNGFEWLFRLVVEPKRLWKRYVLITPRFLPLWAMQKWKSTPPAG